MSFKILLLGAAAGLFPLAPDSGREFPRPGEWPCFRRSPSLDARSPARGRIAAPRIAWKQFVGALESLLIVEPGDGDAEILLPEDETAGNAAPPPPPAGFFPAEGAAEEADSPTVVYADAFPEEPGQEKLEFESAFNKRTVSGRWQEAVGRCFARRDGRWVQLWETEPIAELFQPLPLAGDFDGNGALEVAILPLKDLLLLDGRTGKVKDRCRFTETRSYGYFGAFDFDGDRKSEFLIQADFSKHLDVLGFRGQKLQLLWQRPIELDISNPLKIFRAAPDPAADVDGDGRPELLACIFNDRGDGRWHISVHDALTGKIQAELAEEYLLAALDLDGDKTSEVATLHGRGGGIPDFGILRIWSMKGGSPALLWQRERASLQTADAPLPPGVKSTALFGKRTVLRLARERGPLVVLKEKMGDLSTETRLSITRWEAGELKTGPAVRGAGLEALAFDGSGRLLIRCRHQPGCRAAVKIERGKAALHSTRRLGAGPSPPTVAWLKGAKRPMIAVQGCGEEVIAFQPPDEGKPAALTRLKGRGQSAQWPDLLRGPVIADLDGDGGRQILLAAAAPSGCARLAATSLAGEEIWHHDFEKIPGSPPVWNSGGIIFWQTGRFTHPERQDVLVTVRRSMMHSEETALLSGIDGRLIWERDRQISQRGVGGAPFAIADFDGDGLDDLASFFPSLVYLMKGSSGRNLLAKDASWDAVPAKPVYWGLPTAGPFGEGGRQALYFGGPSMTGLMNLDGSLAWWDALDQSPPDWPAFGDFDGDGALEAMGIGYVDGVRCYSAATGRILWRLPAPFSGAPAGSASADLDSDGRDEALWTSGNNLYCLGPGASGTAGALRWRIDFPAVVGPPAVAILEEGGSASILLAGADGYVYGVRGF
ncbi:MAG: hypothetical protein HY717_06790 [Planctomycetes bacterium]|nr:hypothetical protein [Planctomycetota bacterium]